MIIVGRVSGLFGVQGWLKVFSYTDPRERIVAYGHWYLRSGGQWKAYAVEAGRRQGKTVVARLEGVDSRDAAAGLAGCDIAVHPDQLQPLPAGEYYWMQLIGLQVVNQQGEPLGVVERMMDTGANDVMVVAGTRERLIPFVMGPVVTSVDLEAGTIRVDWHPDD